VRKNFRGALTVLGGKKPYAVEVSKKRTRMGTLNSVSRRGDLERPSITSGIYSGE